MSDSVGLNYFKENGNRLRIVHACMLLVPGGLTTILRSSIINGVENPSKILYLCQIKSITGLNKLCMTSPIQSECE